MFNFENGNLIEDAYVEINGVKYPVHMPKYERKYAFNFWKFE